MTHCPACDLDIRGSTWCSLQKPGCPMPDSPPDRGDVPRQTYRCDSPLKIMPKYIDGNPKTVYGTAKPPISAIPPVAIFHLGLAMDVGRRKYGLTNWRDDPVSISTYYDAAQRHMMAYLDGEDYDKECVDENGQPIEVHNLALAMACCSIILDAREQGTLIDNRTKTPGRAGDFIRYNTRKTPK